MCPLCGTDMRVIAFVTDAPTIHDILVHLGEPTAPPRVAPARQPARARPPWRQPPPEVRR